MPDTDDAPVTQEEIEAVTIAGLPELTRRMLKNGSEPEVDVPPVDPTAP
jgi:hypothetical protein